MPSTVTNQSRNTATPTNQELSSAGLTWNSATFTWDEASGTWGNPYSLVNQTKNSGNLTNQTSS